MSTAQGRREVALNGPTGTAESKKDPGGVVSGRTKDDRGWVKVMAPTEKKKVLLPAPKGFNGFSLARGKRSGKVRSRGRGTVARLPPQLATTVTCHHVFRYAAKTTQSSLTVTWARLAGSCGVVCTVTNSTVLALASSIRVHSIKIWNGVETANGVRSEVNWATPTAGTWTKDESKSDALPTGVTQTPCLVSKPPRDSVWRDWFSAGTLGSTSANVFLLTCPDGSIIDVSISWTLANNIGATSITGITTAVLGSVYYLGLDGTSGNVVPVGVPTTI